MRSIITFVLTAWDNFYHHVLFAVDLFTCRCLKCQPGWVQSHMQDLRQIFFSPLKTEGKTILHSYRKCQQAVIEKRGEKITGSVMKPNKLK